MSGLPNGVFDEPNLRLSLSLMLAQTGLAARSSWRTSALAIWLLLMRTGALVWAEEGVYSWKDATGRVHYSNRPPIDQPATLVPLNANPVTVQPTERIYTWTDSAGKTHYAAKPPTGVEAKELKEDDSSLSTIHSGQLRPGEETLLQEVR